MAVSVTAPCGEVKSLSGLSNGLHYVAWVKLLAGPG
jgi:hypothetical protein